MTLARAKEVEIWTSAEVFKITDQGQAKSLPVNKDAEFEAYVDQDFLVVAQVDIDIGVLARRLLRKHQPLKKPPDAIHLATAVLNNVDEFHTVDAVNLLPLDGKINRADGVA